MPLIQVPGARAKQMSMTKRYIKELGMQGIDALHPELDDFDFDSDMEAAQAYSDDLKYAKMQREQDEREERERSEDEENWYKEEMHRDNKH